jgi:hypothetical protein
MGETGRLTEPAGAIGCPALIEPGVQIGPPKL